MTSSDGEFEVERALFQCICVQQGSIDEFKAILKGYDADIDEIRLLGSTLLAFVAQEGRLDLVEEVFRLGANVNADERDNRTSALTQAIAGGNPGIVALMLERGADATYGRPLISAINAENSFEIVKLLVEYGADVHQSYTFGPPPTPVENALSWAIARGKHDVADYLRSLGAVMPNQTALEPGSPVDLESEIVAFFENKFGKANPLALREIVPDDPSVSIHAIPPSRKRVGLFKKHRSVLLFTTGMSRRPMNTPPDGQNFRFAEVFVELPGDWPIEEADQTASAEAWPFQWLRSIAGYPFRNSTWLGGPMTIIANDDPPQPLAPGLDFTSILLIAEKQHITKDGRNIRFYRMMPLYTEERDLEIEKGAEYLMRAFDKARIPFVVDLNRRNVAVSNKRMK